MTVTKSYSYFLHYDRGIAQVTDELYTESLKQAVMRARWIPEHRIVIETGEDPTDPCDVGAAMRRLEALRQHFMAESVLEQRLEMQAYGGICSKERKNSGAFARRADINLFPRVASLFPDVGDRFLSYNEVDVLESARQAVFEDDDVVCTELECRYTTVEWKRIVGHESLRKWTEAGSYHPYLVSVGLNTRPRRG